MMCEACKNDPAPCDRCQRAGELLATDEAMRLLMDLVQHDAYAAWEINALLVRYLDHRDYGERANSEQHTQSVRTAVQTMKTLFSVDLLKGQV